MVDEKALLQVYFYKTYLYQQSVKKALQYRSTKSTEGNVDNEVQNRYKKDFEWFYMYSPEFFSLLQKVKALKASSQRRKPAQFSSHGKRRVKKFAKPLHQFKMKGRTFNRAKTMVARVVRPQHSVVMYNQFFTYFFLHFFKMQAIVLAKSLYKAVTANALFKHEHQVLLYRTRFLKWHK